MAVTPAAEAGILASTPLTVSSAATEMVKPFTAKLPAPTTTPESKSGPFNPVALKAASALTCVPTVAVATLAAVRKPLVSPSSASVEPAMSAAKTRVSVALS